MLLDINKTVVVIHKRTGYDLCPLTYHRKVLEMGKKRNRPVNIQNGPKQEISLFDIPPIDQCAHHFPPKTNHKAPKAQSHRNTSEIVAEN